MQNVYLNGENLGTNRQPEISMYASAVSAIPAAQNFSETQNHRPEHSVVMDGRDIGTVILPDADIKIFLTATDEVRARRRYNELLAKGIEVKYEDVLAEMKERDARDRSREIAPAIPAPDAVILDNSDCTNEESVEDVLRIIKEKL